MTRQPTPRRGFTLIELLVVMTIIIILSGMTLAVVQKVRAMSLRTSAANDISQLAVACEAFKRDYGFYPPQNKTGPTIDLATIKSALNRMFPRAKSNIDMMTALPGDFSGYTELDNNQGLVFFLGGPSLVGWDSADPRTAVPTGSTKKQPHFDFPEHRLKDPTVGTKDFRFRDPWGTPYAYFRSVEGNDYGGSFTSNGTTVTPYKQGVRFVNQNSIQIISAGANGRSTIAPMGFGIGDEWVPGTGDYSSTANGFDDMANFNQGAQLGVEVQAAK